MLRLARAKNSLAIHNLRATAACRHVVFAKQSVADDLKVQLAHARDQGLPRLRIFADVERGILLGHLLQRGLHLFCIGRGVGLDSLRDHRLISADGLQQDRSLGIAQRVARRSILQTDGKHDAAGVRLLQLFATSGMD